MAGTAADGLQVVVFRLGSEEYGIDIDHVREIIRRSEATPVPHAAKSVKGVINLRGKIIAIVDLRTRFGLPEAERSASERIIVMEVENHLVGVEVDAATEVLQLEADSVEPPPEVLSSEDMVGAVMGVAKIGDRLIVLLKLEQVLPLADVAKVGEEGGG